MLPVGAAMSAEESKWGFDYAGLLDLRLAKPSRETSWLEGGFGKVRYGADSSDPTFRFSETSLILMPRYGWDLSGYFHLKADSDQDQLVDLIEGYVSYKPVSTTENRYRLRAGIFYPPISLENTAIAWTSPYSITTSAINTWVGEETRGYGIEGSWQREVGENKISLTGAVLWGTDKAGTVLYRRGWALHDYRPAINDDLPVPLPASAPYLATTSRSMVETDHRPGYYLSFEWKDLDGKQLRLMYYDNQTDPSSVNGAENGWLTRFVSAGLQLPLAYDIELISQYMNGYTLLDVPGFAELKTDFDSAFVLLTKKWEKYRLTGRVDWFEVEDVDHVASDFSEDGWSTMLAGCRDIFKSQSLWLELLYISSRRPTRATATEGDRWDDVILQASYRLEF